MQQVLEVKEKLSGLSSDQTINVVLSGGAMKGVAHLPLLEYLEQRDIKINSISGTSAGAVVAVMYASGMKPQEILDFFIAHPLFRYSWIRPGKGGLFNTHKYSKHFEPFIKSKFEELQVPVHICSTNLSKAKPEYFSKGEIMQKLIASCAVPGIYSSIEMNGHLYADGGVMDNYPVQPFENSNLPIVGSFVRVPHLASSGEIKSTRHIMKRSVFLQRYAIEIPKFESTYLTILNDLKGFSAFKQKDAQAIYDFTKQKYFL